MVARARAPGDPAFKVVSIVSSAFFWPYPHPWECDFQLGGKIETKTDLPYRVRNGSEVESTDDFTILRIDPERVRVRVFDRKGDPLGAKTHRFA